VPIVAGTIAAVLTYPLLIWSGICRAGHAPNLFSSRSYHHQLLTTTFPQ